MVLFSSTLMLLNNNKVIDTLSDIDNVSKMVNNNIYILIYMSLLLLFTSIPAVLVAINCNKDDKLFYGFMAFIFSDIYMIQWSIKKFIIKDASYCKI